MAGKQMSDEDFKGVMEGLGEVAAFLRGEELPGVGVHIPAELDVRAIRDKLGLTQTEFARRYGFSAARVRDWEQGRRAPDSGVRAYLKVIAAEPALVERVLARAEG
jgi:putative transcriptional regulator